VSQIQKRRRDCQLTVGTGVGAAVGELELILLAPAALRGVTPPTVRLNAAEAAASASALPTWAVGTLKMTWSLLEASRLHSQLTPSVKPAAMHKPPHAEATHVVFWAKVVPST
jgi:hypothetical protein